MVCTQEKYQLYGREQESKQLQRIVVESIRCRGHHNNNGDDDDTQTAEHNHHDGPAFRFSNLKSTSTSLHNDDNYSNNSDVSYNKDSSFVLIHGPRGIGKKTFACQTLQNISGCITDGNTSTLHCDVVTDQIDGYDNSSAQSPFLFVSGQYRPVNERTTDTGTTKSPHQKSRNVDERPFAAFDEAIQGIMNKIFKHDTMMNEIRQNLMKIITSPNEINVLTTAFPSMNGWLNNTNTSPNEVHISTAGITTLDFKQTLHGIPLMEQQVQVRCPAMIHFLQAVLSVIPVTMLLVDLHFADAASISLMDSLLKQRDNETTPLLKLKGLLIVATVQNNDEDLSRGTIQSLLNGCQVTCNGLAKCSLCTLVESNSIPSTTELKAHDDTRIIPTINSIQISELNWDEINLWIQTHRIFKMYTMEQQRHVSDLVYHHSFGNPLRAQYIILYLEGESFHDEINKKTIPRSLGELYTKILLRQSNSVQDIIKTVAVLIHAGSEGVKLDILDIATDRQCIDIILNAGKLQLLQFKQATNTVSFTHHEFQEAAYEMIPISERPLFHLNIGRRLWRNAILCQGELPTANDDTTKVLLATSQLRNSISLLSDVNERIYMSQLCYETGHKLFSVSDYVNAAKIFDFAICVLGTEIWRDDMYEASLALHNAAAQAYCYSGDIDLTEKVLDGVFSHARTFHDQVPAYIGLMYAQGVQHQLGDLVQTASHVLKELGEPLNQNPTQLDIIMQMIRTQWILNRKSDRFLLNLPHAENEKYKIVTQILSFAMHHSFPKNPEMSIVICCRMVRLTITNGMTGPSTQALSLFGCLLSASGDFDNGYRFGELAIRLVEKFEAWLPRTYLYMYGYTNHWIHPIRDCLEPLTRAIQLSYQHGDFEIYGLLLSVRCAVMLFGGSPLNELKLACRTYCQSLAALGCASSLLVTIPIFDFIVKISGDEEPINIDHDIKNADAAFKYSIKEGDKFCTGRWYMHRTMLLFLTGEYFDAVEMAEKAAKQSPMTGFILPFYHGLSALAIAWTCKPNLRRKFLRDGNKKAMILKSWSKRCPTNFKNKYLLLVAEISGLNGKVKKALDFYDRSIEAATIEGFSLEKAIAFERLGRYYLNLANNNEAKKNLLNAKKEYGNWGSKPLSKKIDDLLSSIK